MALIQRLYKVHRTSTRPTWCRGRGPRAFANHEAADATGKIVRADGLPPAITRWTDIQLILNAFRERAEWIYDKSKWDWILRACLHCGGIQRLPASIPEPVGLVCLDCRLNVAGHVWDERYDAYLVPSQTSIATSATKGGRRQRSTMSEVLVARGDQGASVSHSPRAVS